MMNTLLNNLKTVDNFKTTENGGVAHKTTGSAVYDMFALGAAYRQRSEDDVKFLFKKAFDEDPVYALKCLFWMRDIRGGAGERRFFKVAIKYLAQYDADAVVRNLTLIPFYGRYDDLYALVGTPVEKQMFDLIKHQLALDVECKTPSLLAKWLKSENTSSATSQLLGKKTRKALGLTSKQYRKILSTLRARINIVERLMSENRWDEIEFDKIPSKAGLIYKNAFARHDIERVKANKATYESFIKDENTTVNADALFPYEIVNKVTKKLSSGYNYRAIDMSELDRMAVQKYWDNQKDYLNGAPCKMMCVCDTSGSMTWANTNPLPIDVAISLSMYCAERVGGPFKNHYISFSSRPQLISIGGIDFADKVYRIYQTNLCDNTDLLKTFKLIRDLSFKSKPEDRLDTIVVISDMEIDAGHWGVNNYKNQLQTDMEKERKEWALYGMKMPRLVYWNVNARNDTILDLGPNVTLVSGASPSLFQQVLTGKTGIDLMYETLNQERYAQVK